MVEEKSLKDQCVEYIKNNFNELVYGQNTIKQAYSQMCLQKCPLENVNLGLYSHLQDLMEDFGIDNALCEDWYEEESIYVEDIFLCLI